MKSLDCENVGFVADLPKKDFSEWDQRLRWNG